MSREAFEHWYADYTGDAHIRKYCDSTGRYQFNAMQSAWNAWQAALQHSGEPSEWVIEVENGQVVMSRIGANFTGYLYTTPQPVVDGNTSDGYHTFNELYDFRKAYNAAFFNELHANNKCSVHKSWRHHDNELCFGGGWFIVVAVLPTGQISNHYEAKDWNLFAIPETEKALVEFDGHTGKDVLERLNGYTPQPVVEGLDFDFIAAVLEDYCFLQTSGIIAAANRYATSDVNEQIDLLSAGKGGDV